MVELNMIGAWQIILILCVFLIPIIALIDVIRNDFKGNNKLIWVIVILFTSIFGVLLYLTLGASQKIKN